MKFFFLPFLAYFLAGSIKFLINSVRFRSFALNRIGLGGFPSTHISIISSAAWAIILSDFFSSPISSLAVAITMIVIIDALDTRNKIGNLAREINKINSGKSKFLREKTGHNYFEVLGGLLLGFITSLIVAML